MVSVPETILKKANTAIFSLSEFVIKNNFFVIPLDGVFHYFSIKADHDTIKSDAPLIRLTRLPSKPMDGIAMLAGKTYLAPWQDVSRGIIRKSRFVTLDSQGIPYDNPCSEETQSTESDQSSARTPARNYEHAVGGDVELEDSAAADAAFQEQIESLLVVHDSEEEWEVSETA